MNNSGYKYSLDRGSKKVNCPNCRKKTFVLYVDMENSNYLPGHYGRCDREQKCGYFLQPEKKFNSHSFQPVKELKPKPTYLSLEYVDKYYNSEEEKRNNFILFLKTLFSEKEVTQIVNDYLISSCFYWNGAATIFWQIDQNEKVRSGQVILYDHKTGKRKKVPFNHITWVHSILQKEGKIKEFVLSQCLFGLHLLNDYPEKNMIAIVEAPKTACIMSAKFPNYIWMATCGLSNLKPELFKPLKEKRIVLYPDLGAFGKWKDKADLLKKHGFNVEVSDLLENKCRGSNIGSDIADYFI